MMDIRVNGLLKSFDGKRVLDGFSAEFPDGGITCIMGESGCGKTTLLNVLMGFIQPDGGDLSGVPARISAVFQEDRLCEDFSAVSNIRLVTGAERSRGDIEALLRRLGLGESMHRPVREFSGGMKRRVALARALLYDSGLLILDEAFKGLDDASKDIALECVREYAAGRTVIAVTHDAEEARALGGKLIKMEVAA